MTSPVSSDSYFYRNLIGTLVVSVQAFEDEDKPILMLAMGYQESKIGRV